MANEGELKILQKGVAAWNSWRHDYPDVTPDLSGANLVGVNLSNADLEGVNLSAAALTQANLTRANFSNANLNGANLDEATLYRAELNGASLIGATLSAAVLSQASLITTNFRAADLSKARLISANLYGANLNEAQLNAATLTWANLCGTNVQDAELADCNVYGISAWDLEGVPKDESNLVITRVGEAPITVDSLKVAQFVHLLLHNPNIRDVIDTVGKKGVLILGRFGERLRIVNALRQKLREAGYVPMVFDFERVASRDFTETVMTLAGMSAFIIADITQPRSVQQELQAAIPDYMIPFVPIIQKGEEPYSMFVDLQHKYGKWVLDLLEYDDVEQLVRAADAAIIEPAQVRRGFLLAEKAEGLRKRYAAEFENPSR